MFKDYLKDHNIKVADLEARTGISKQTLYNWARKQHSVTVLGADLIVTALSEMGYHTTIEDLFLERSPETQLELDFSAPSIPSYIEVDGIAL